MRLIKRQTETKKMPKVIPKTLKEIRDVIGGEVQKEQDTKDQLVIDSLAVSPQTSCEDDLLIIFDQKYLKDLTSIKAKAMILPSLVKDKITSFSIPIIWVERPRLVLKKLLELFSNRPLVLPGIHKTAVIEPSSKISKSAFIGANVYIGSNVVIGDNCILYVNCTILDNVTIGKNVIVHSGAVIGADGYSYVTEEESNLEKAKKGNFNFNLGRQIQHKILSIGGVVIEDDVEIGANSCVDAGTIRPTVIGSGTKIDNLVQIAHNCKIGKDCLIVGQVGFAGSVNVGDRVVAGGQSGFADNINIGDDVIFVARAAVHGNIPSNSVYMGMPAVPYQDYFKNEKIMRRLPRKQEKLEEQIKILENKVKELEEKLLSTSLRGA